MTKREKTIANGQNHRSRSTITTTITITESSTLPSLSSRMTEAIVDFRSQSSPLRKRHKVFCCTRKPATPPAILPLGTMSLCLFLISIAIPLAAGRDVVPTSATSSSSTTSSSSGPPRTPITDEMHLPEAQASSQYNFRRPSPFNPDYRPDCDLIFPASSQVAAVHETEPSSAFIPSAHLPPPSLPASSHYGASYFSQLDHQPHGEFLSNSEDVSSFMPSSSSKPSNAYLSNFAPRYVPHCDLLLALSLLNYFKWGALHYII